MSMQLYGFGWLFMILFWVLLILGIVYLVKLIIGGTKREEKVETSIDIFKKEIRTGINLRDTEPFPQAICLGTKHIA
jgi:uncharacterized membrane protein